MTAIEATLKCLGAGTMIGDISIAADVFIVTDYTDMQKSVDDLDLEQPKALKTA